LFQRCIEYFRVNWRYSCKVGYDIDLVDETACTRCNTTSTAKQSTAIDAAIVRRTIRWAAVDRIGRFNVVGMRRVDNRGWTGVRRNDRTIAVGGFCRNHVRLRRWTGVEVPG
jgi:hypothetical protein